MMKKELTLIFNFEILFLIKIMTFSTFFCR